MLHCIVGKNRLELFILTFCSFSIRSLQFDSVYERELLQWKIKWRYYHCVVDMSNCTKMQQQHLTFCSCKLRKKELNAFSLNATCIR